jgi:hypothetical protein
MPSLEEIDALFAPLQGARLVTDQANLFLAGGSQDRAAALEQHYNNFNLKYQNEGAFDTYIFCLSEHKRDDDDGLLSMWRGYGGQGRGAAIVFDTSKLTLIPSSPLTIAKVSYASKSDRLNELAGLVSQWAATTSNAQLPDDQLWTASLHAYAIVLNFALTRKHVGFCEEQEWRIIYTADRDKDGLLRGALGYQITSNGVEPKLKYGVGKIQGVSSPELTLQKMVDRIILGPSLSFPLARKGVARMFESMEKPDYIDLLKASTIPFRPTERLAHT